jgi:ABC-type Na+ efflux pump permease subunit
MVVDVVSTDTAQQVSTLISTFTVVLVPAIGGLVLAIVNFIHHHTHSARTEAIATQVAALTGKMEAVNTQIDASKGAIAAVAASDPNISGAIASHEAELTLAKAKIAQMADEISKLKATIPTA